MEERRPYVIVGVIVVACLIGFIVAGYWFNWDWTGFNRPSKTLWDWLQLLGVLAVPVVVGFGAVWFTTRQGRVADAENKDNQRETALQAYIDKMSELLLEKKLRDSAEEDEVRKIARVRTMTILPRLDATRKSSVLLFLHESGLIEKGKCIINLSGANLSGANLRTDNLSEANLSGADLSDADLFGANLSGANMHEVNLNKANMQRVNLNGANLSNAYLLNGANLSGADLREADLSGVSFSDANLSGVTMSGANMHGVSLRRANLSKAYLRGANLFGADLRKADLSEANLSDATITTEQLDEVESLKGATMPDGSIHP